MAACPANECRPHLASLRSLPPLTDVRRRKLPSLNDNFPLVLPGDHAAPAKVQMPDWFHTNPYRVETAAAGPAKTAHSRPTSAISPGRGVRNMEESVLGQSPAGTSRSRPFGSAHRSRNTETRMEIESFVFPVRKERPERSQRSGRTQCTEPRERADRTEAEDRKLRRVPPAPLEVEKFNRTASHSTLAPTESPHTSSTSSSTSTPLAATPLVSSAKQALAASRGPTAMGHATGPVMNFTNSSSPLPSPTSCKGSFPLPLMKTLPGLPPTPTKARACRWQEEVKESKHEKPETSKMQVKQNQKNEPSKPALLQKGAPEVFVGPTVPETPSPAAAATYAMVAVSVATAMVAVSPAVAPAAAKPVPAPAPPRPEVEDLAIEKANIFSGADDDMFGPRAPARRDSRYRLGEILGQGSYGMAAQCMDVNTGNMIAVKTLVKQVNHDSRREECIKCLKAEIKLCSTLRHPNIITYLGYEMEEDGTPFLFLDYMAGGSLSSGLSDYGPLNMRLVKRAMRGILRGVNYLHSRSPQVLHRDIKGANVLVDQYFNIKLADFGCSLVVEDSLCFEPAAGSIPWMAPEVADFKNGYGLKADVWSIGCTLIELVGGVRPWSELKIDDRTELFALIGSKKKTPQVPAAVTTDGVAFCDACLKLDPQERPSAAKLLQHQFLRR